MRSLANGRIKNVVVQRYILDKLQEHRRALFVGRSDELNLFRKAVAADGWPFSFLQMSGPGGTGKTYLLEQFRAICEEQEVPFIGLDCRFISASPSVFQTAIEEALNSAKPSFGDLLNSPDRRWVLALDTFETLTPLHNWIRDVFALRLPVSALLITSGRQVASTAADAARSKLTRSVVLGELSSDETFQLIQKETKASPEQQQAIFDMTCGHPLAAALAVEQLVVERHWVPAMTNVPEQLVARLLSLVLNDTPTPEHRKALEISSIARLTTEDLLTYLLPQADGHNLFQWLRNLSFFQTSPDGIYPHDLARVAISTDLLWRSPRRYRWIQTETCRFLLTDVQNLADKPVPIIDVVFLRREDLVLRQFVVYDEVGDKWVERGQPEDVSALENMVAEHEGSESAKLVRQWIDLQPEALWVCRDKPGDVSGFSLELVLTPNMLNQSGLPHDPAIEAALSCLQAQGATTSGARALYLRWWLTREHYQDVSSDQNLLFFHAMQTYTVTPGLVFTFLPVAKPETWHQLFCYAHFDRTVEADYQMGDATYAVYTHDWRAESPSSWLEGLVARDVMTPPVLPQAATPISSSEDRPTLTVGPETLWVVLPDGTHLDLKSHGKLRLILSALLKQLKENPGCALTVDDLFAAGWPGEKAIPSAGSARVYVAVASLRKFGLRGLLSTSEEGYFLDPELVVTKGRR